MPLFVSAGALVPMLPDDVDTLIRRNDKISPTVVTLDDRRIIRVWNGNEGAFSTSEGIKGQLNANSLTISAERQIPLEIHFMFREMKNIAAKGADFSCAYEPEKNAAVCRAKTFQGSVNLTW